MDFQLLLLLLICVLIGSALGTFSGLVPGIHVNTLATLLLVGYLPLLKLLSWLSALVGVSSTLSPYLCGCLIISAAVVHGFLDFIPSVFFGAPEEDECLTTLPGHRLLLKGKGYQAVLSASYGSLCGSLLALILCIPLILASSIGLYQRIDPFIPGLLIIALLLLILSHQDQVRAEAEMRLIDVLPSNIVSIRHPLPFEGEVQLLTGTISRHGVSSWFLVGGRAYRLKGGPLSPGRCTLQVRWHLRRVAWERKAAATFLILLSGLLGMSVMFARPPLAGTFSGWNGDLLLPLLSGLFAVPLLLQSSTRDRPLPEQELSEAVPPDLLSSVQGSLAGAFSALVPGITSTSGTVLGMMLRRQVRTDDLLEARRFIAMTAAVGNAATVFGVVLLCLIGQGSTGALMVVSQMLGPTLLGDLSRPLTGGPALFLLALLLASFLGFLLTNNLGRYFARRAHRSLPSRSSLLILSLMVALCAIFTGLPGLLLLTVSGLVGTLPPRLGVSRVCLTGSLIVPVLISNFDLTDQFYRLMGVGA